MPLHTYITAARGASIEAMLITAIIVTIIIIVMKEEEGVAGGQKLLQ